MKIKVGVSAEVRNEFYEQIIHKQTKVQISVSVRTDLTWVMQYFFGDLSLQPSMMMKCPSLLASRKFVATFVTLSGYKINQIIRHPPEASNDKFISDRSG